MLFGKKEKESQEVKIITSNIELEIFDYVKDVINETIDSLYKIQDINREGSTPEKKIQRINQVINLTGKKLIKLKNELP